LLGNTEIFFMTKSDVCDSELKQPGCFLRSELTGRGQWHEDTRHIC